jgi:hypothetical protein
MCRGLHCRASGVQLRPARQVTNSRGRASENSWRCPGACCAADSLERRWRANHARLDTPSLAANSCRRAQYLRRARAARCRAARANERRFAARPRPTRSTRGALPARRLGSRAQRGARRDVVSHAAPQRRAARAAAPGDPRAFLAAAVLGARGPRTVMFSTRNSCVAATALMEVLACRLDSKSA